MDLNTKKLQEAINRINKEKNKEIQIAKINNLVRLLIKIEKELETVNNNLAKLWEINTKAGKSNFASQIATKMNEVDKLKEKVTKMRLNLNFYLL